ncbi:MAG: exodeoxyribonuclease III [Spirochaetae bacterium HGW-Spirochaetae-7]|jgi:exodeoxyribonuclease-3|nr:MAG: exodeoxyribonuclease III [Spirochaetae bacterium HGW-Spirochaetae-7]
MTRVASWNVNGIRAAAEKGFFAWLSEESADIVCVQETKADPSQLSKQFFEATDSAGAPYSAFWSSAVRRGYSGVAIYTRLEPKATRNLGIAEFDDEGRFLEADFGDIVVASAYFPNSQEAGARLGYKLRFCDAVLDRCDAIVAEGRHVVVSGDFNIAHEPIDLTYPDANKENPGYLPEEREWMSKFLALGYADTFRRFHPGEAGLYSWWSYRMKARERDIGWRLDYHCVDEALMPAVRSVAIRKMVMGSDHCPVIVEFER